MTEQRPHVLVVDDERQMVSIVGFALETQGFTTSSARSAEEAWRMFGAESFDLVVLDVMLPGASGVRLCERIRTVSDVPVILLTARGEESDRLAGLLAGADDYVTKPFSPRELVSRVKAVLRRAEGVARRAPAIFRFDGFEVDVGRREARVDGVPVPLATREFDLLLHLCENRGLALSRRQLLDGVWGTDWIGDDRTVDVHVRQLRKKLGDALPLDTVWGVGYRFG